MPFTRLQLRNFRNIRGADLSPSPFLNVICGVNASGKTSVLEALYEALADRQMSITLSTEGRTRTIRLRLPAFTLLAATTEEGELSDALRVPARHGMEVAGKGTAEQLPHQLEEAGVHSRIELVGLETPDGQHAVLAVIAQRNECRRFDLLRAVAEQRNFKKVVAWNRSPERLATLEQLAQDIGLPFED